MNLKQSVSNIFNQLITTLNQLTDEQYSCSIETLSNASIGQHVRHVIEIFGSLQKGYEAGVVNYEKRKRDLEIETIKKTAIQLLHQIIDTLYTENKILILETNFDKSGVEIIKLETNYYREVAYNLEHTIHHMALIKIGLHSLRAVQVPNDFGVASSTLLHRNERINS